MTNKSFSRPRYTSWQYSNIIVSTNEILDMIYRYLCHQFNMTISPRTALL